MNLRGRIELAARLRSPSQVAKVITEDWCNRELYCPVCDSERLLQEPPNSRACDFTCASCRERFELKSGRGWSQSKIPDAAYGTMIACIRSDQTPNLFVMQYSPTWNIHNLLLIPRYFFVESAIEKRAPLASTARRAGWIGCNILLHRIADEGKIGIVVDGAETPREQVRALVKSTESLRAVPARVRGWTLDVLTAIRRLNQPEFSLADAYSLENHLAQLHPDNRNVRPKIRQQLQVLRNLGLLEFLGDAHYRLRDLRH
jgi:type II restriction enzyme